MPTRRGEVQATVLAGKLYVAGGIDLGHSLATFEAFDPRSGRWTELAPLPRPHDHIGIATLGGKIYVTGGGDFFAPSTTDSAWVYDPARDRWSSLPSMPARRIAHAMVAIGGRLYLFGGIIGGRAPNETWSFDPATGHWDAGLAPIPTYREHLAATTVSGRAWVIGGREVSPLPAVEVYDPATDSWTTGPPLPAGRGGLTAATIGGTIHVTGGEDWDLNRTWPTHFTLDPGDSAWTRLPDLPTSRHGLASGGIDGQWIVVGGGRGPFVNISDVVEIYTP